MTIKIISVGSKPSAEISALINDYARRLPSSVKIVWRYIKHSKINDKHSMKHEAENILRNIESEEKVVLLDEKGRQISSPQLSHKLFSDSKDVTIVIGGAYGSDSSVKERADFIWSLGELVYPHQLVRLVLAEQIYRAYCIKVGHPYHHD